MGLSILKIMNCNMDDDLSLEMEISKGDDNLMIEIAFDSWEYTDKKTINEAKKILKENIKYSNNTIVGIKLDKNEAINLINFIKASFDI